MRKSVTIVLLLLVSLSLWSQEFEPYEEGGSEKFASFCMEFGNYGEALVEYQELLKSDPLNSFYKLQVARCHLHLNRDKSQAIPILLELAKFDDYNQPEVLYNLGLTYLAIDSIGKAQNALEKYLEVSKKDKNRLPAKRLLEMCQAADSMKQQPVNISMSNLGEDINSAYADFLPMIIRDESFILFTSEREENTGKFITLKGRYNADLWSSRYYSGEWRRARTVTGTVNTKYSEYGVCMTADGQQLLMVFDPEEGNRFVLHTTKTRRTFNNPDPYSEDAINKENHDINGAWISRDGSFLLLSLETEDGFGGFDIYISYLLPNKDWSQPRNLGPQINTPYHDAFPSLTPDEEQLVFASEGHNSMGGYDLMITPFSPDSNHRFNVRNMGYPVNTTIDDKSITFSENMRHAYKSYLMKDGLGDLDIYRISFQDTMPEYSIIRGCLDIEQLSAEWQVQLKDSLITMDSLKKISPYRNVNITAISISEKADNEGARIKPDPFDGCYNIALPPGDYRIHFEMAGYQSEKMNINIPDRSNRDKIIRKDIQLKIKESE